MPWWTQNLITEVQMINKTYLIHISLIHPWTKFCRNWPVLPKICPKGPGAGASDLVVSPSSFSSSCSVRSWWRARYPISSPLVMSPSLFSSSCSVRTLWSARYFVSSALVIWPSLFPSNSSVRCWWKIYHLQLTYETILTMFCQTSASLFSFSSAKAAACSPPSLTPCTDR